MTELPPREIELRNDPINVVLKLVSTKDTPINIIGALLIGGETFVKNEEKLQEAQRINDNIIMILEPQKDAKPICVKQVIIMIEKSSKSF